MHNLGCRPMHALALVTFASLASLPVAAQPSTQPGGYAGQQTREVKALSAQDMADLAAGRGMGLARAGELNHYPGPAHVLELRDRLGLTPAQVEVVQASFGRMGAAAKPLGAELIRRERALDDAFKAGTVTPAGMVSETEGIGTLQGRLRAVHLAAHLDMRSVLSAEQVARYDALRGYAGPDAGPTAAPAHRMHPG